MFRKTVIAGFTFAAVLGGCSNAAKSKADPVVKMTEKPQRAHMLDLRFAQQPGTLNNIQATANFVVENRACVAMDYKRALGGVALPPEHNVPLTLKKTGPDQYEAVFYDDALQDEDYFGLGMCHWALKFVTVRFQSPSTLFIAGLSDDEIAAKKPEIHYYLNSDYAQKPPVGDQVFGEKSRNFYLPKMGPQFQAILTAR